MARSARHPQHQPPRPAAKPIAQVAPAPVVASVAAVAAPPPKQVSAAEIAEPVDDVVVQFRAAVAATPLATFVLRETIRLEHEGRHGAAAALGITDRCLGELVLSLPAAIESADADLMGRLNDLLIYLTR